VRSAEVCQLDTGILVIDDSTLDSFMHRNRASGVALSGKAWGELCKELTQRQAVWTQGDSHTLGDYYYGKISQKLKTKILNHK